MGANLLAESQDNVLKLFRSIHALREDLESSIRSLSEVVTVKKKEQLLHIGDTSTYIYFITQGALRTYYIDTDGNDMTSWLLFENELAISVYSFFSQKPSFEAIEALEDSILLRLSYDKLSKLYREYPEFNYIGRTLTEQYYIRSEEKANALRMLSAKERYLALLQKSPHILQRVSLGHIASYLGITQHTLSRIRKQI